MAQDNGQNQENEGEFSRKIKQKVEATVEAARDAEGFDNIAKILAENMTLRINDSESVRDLNVLAYAVLKQDFDLVCKLVDNGALDTGYIREIRTNGGRYTSRVESEVEVFVQTKTVVLLESAVDIYLRCEEEGEKRKSLEIIKKLLQISNIDVSKDFEPEEILFEYGRTRYREVKSENDIKPSILKTVLIKGDEQLITLFIEHPSFKTEIFDDQCRKVRQCVEICLNPHPSLYAMFVKNVQYDKRVVQQKVDKIMGVKWRLHDFAGEFIRAYFGVVRDIARSETWRIGHVKWNRVFGDADDRVDLTDPNNPFVIRINNDPFYDHHANDPQVFDHPDFPKLLEAGMTLAVLDENRKTTLHRLIEQNHSSLDTIFKHAKNLDKIVGIQDTKGNTVLHSLVLSSGIDKSKKIQYIQKLIEQGADISKRNLDGRTVVDLTQDQDIQNALRRKVKIAPALNTTQTDAQVLLNEPTVSAVPVESTTPQSTIRVSKNPNHEAVVAHLSGESRAEDATKTDVSNHQAVGTSSAPTVGTSTALEVGSSIPPKATSIVPTPPTYSNIDKLVDMILPPLERTEQNKLFVGRIQNRAFNGGVDAIRGAFVESLKKAMNGLDESDRSIVNSATDADLQKSADLVLNAIADMDFEGKKGAWFINNRGGGSIVESLGKLLLSLVVCVVTGSKEPLTSWREGKAQAIVWSNEKFNQFMTDIAKEPSAENVEKGKSELTKELSKALKTQSTTKS